MSNVLNDDKQQQVRALGRLTPSSSAGTPRTPAPPSLRTATDLVGAQHEGT